MSSTHYLGICILCAHYLQWSLIYSFQTDNANVIHMSSLVLFIYPIMYNLVSAHCLHKCTLSMSSACCLHMYTSFACHLQHSSYTLLSTTWFPYIVSTNAHCPCHLHVVCTCTHHLLVIFNTPHIPYHPQLSFHTYCLHKCTLSISSVYCLQMHMLCILYMFSFLLLLFAYVHVIRILSEHMCIMRTLSAVVLDIFLPNRQC